MSNGWLEIRHGIELSVVEAIAWLIVKIVLASEVAGIERQRSDIFRILVKEKLHKNFLALQTKALQCS